MTDILTALMFMARLVQSTALLVLLGGTIFLAVVRWPNNDRTRQGRWLEHRAHRYLWGAWAAALAASLLGMAVWGPWTRGEGLGAVFTLESFVATMQTRFGMAGALRVALLLGVAPLLWAGWPWPGGRRRTAGHRRPGWLIAAGLLLTPPLGGHAGGGADPIYGAVVGWIHFSSAAVWGGGLILLLVCVLPRSGLRLRDYVPQFSAMATVSISVATITGSIQSWRQLHSVEALWTTDYGWFLLAKLLAFGLLMLVAAGSHYLTKQAATDPGRLPAMVGGPPRALAVRERQLERDEQRAASLLRRFVAAEVVVAVLVLGATELMANAQPGFVELEQRQRLEAPAAGQPSGPAGGQRATSDRDGLLPDQLGPVGEFAGQAGEPQPEGDPAVLEEQEAQG